MAFESLGYLDQRGRCAEPKGAIVTRKRVKGRKTRAEAKVKKDVRAQCVERDGPCRLRQTAMRDDVELGMLLHVCQGESQWAHKHERRRSQTRGQAPERRHDTKHSFMLCTFLHDQYDGRRKPRLFITSLTTRGADGPLKFRRER